MFTFWVFLVILAINEIKEAGRQMDLMVGFLVGLTVGFFLAMRITNKARMKSKNEMLKMKRNLGVAMRPFDSAKVDLDENGNVNINDWMVKK